MTKLIEIDSLFDGIDYSYTLPRARSEELCMDYFRNSMGPVERCLRDRGIDKVDVHHLVLVEGERGLDPNPRSATYDPRVLQG